MKKTLLLILAALLSASCEKVNLSDEEKTDTKMMKNVRMCVSGDFGSPAFTRSLEANGVELTDLWIFDYVGDELVRIIHQTDEDDDFGEPNVLMEYATHNLYFVASRGLNPSVDEESCTITWSNVRDTFWSSLEMEVDESSASDVYVTLERVVTKLKLNVNDKVPSSLVSLSVTAEEWNNGIQYITCEPVTSDGDAIRIDVPSSYQGTTGSLSFSVFSISGAGEWKTDVTVAAKDVSNSTISSVLLSDVPLKANRATVYSGNLFTSGSTFAISLNDTWLSDKVLSW